MRATLQLPRTATYADYLAIEMSSDVRHELIDGVIVAMAGGPPDHNAIAGRLAMLIGARLERGCRYYSPINGSSSRPAGAGDTRMAR